MPRVILQDFTIDGRREMQPYPTFGQYAYAPYSNVANDVPVKYQLIQRVRMENTTFHLSQIGNYQKTDPGKTTSGVVQVIDSEFYGGGCVQGYPAGPWGAERINGALPCGCERADAGDDCAGWGSHLSTPHTYVDDQQDEFPLLADWICFNEASGTSSCPGWTQQGGNIGVNSASTFLLASSSFDMGPHYLSGVGHTVPNSCTNGYQDIPATGPDVFSPRYCGTGWTAAKNHFYRSGSGAIDNHGSFKTVIKNNVFEGDCMDDQWGDAECKHLSFASSWVVDVQIRDNYFGGQDRRLGLVLDFWRPLPSERDPLTANIWQPVRVEGNTFELDCRLCGPTPQLCAPLTISPGSTNAEFLASDFADELPDVVLKDNVYVDTNAVNNCTGSVLASGYQRSGFNGQQNIRGLTVDGDVYLAGGVNGSADGAGFPGTSSANRNAAYFNYVTDLHLTNVTVNGTGSDGKITFGRSAGADDMAGGCFDPPTFNNACAVEADCLQNRYGLTTPCP
jgi:hypothetical protein